MDETRFEAERVEGHKGVTVVIVPFDPEAQWSRKPVRLAGRRHGWPVSASINGVPFDGYVGERWGRFFVIIDHELHDIAHVSIGQKVSIVVTPASGERVLKAAMAQSTSTTQPKSPRPDAIAPR
jgi:hypothetical protein